MKNLLSILIVFAIALSSAFAFAEESICCNGNCCQVQEIDSEEIPAKTTPEEAYVAWVNLAYPLLLSTYSDGTWCIDLSYGKYDAREYANPSFLLREDMKTATKEEIDTMLLCVDQAWGDFDEDMSYIQRMHRFIHNGDDSLALVIATREEISENIPESYQYLDELMHSLISTISDWHSGLVNDIKSGNDLSNSNHIDVPAGLKNTLKLVEGILGFE